VDAGRVGDGGRGGAHRVGDTRRRLVGSVDTKATGRSRNRRLSCVSHRMFVHQGGHCERILDSAGGERRRVEDEEALLEEEGARVAQLVKGGGGHEKDYGNGGVSVGEDHVDEDGVRAFRLHELANDRVVVVPAEPPGIVVDGALLGRLKGHGGNQFLVDPLPKGVLISKMGGGPVDVPQEVLKYPPAHGEVGGERRVLCYTLALGVLASSLALSAILIIKSIFEFL